MIRLDYNQWILRGYGLLLFTDNLNLVIKSNNYHYTFLNVNIRIFKNKVLRAYALVEVFTLNYIVRC